MNSDQRIDLLSTILTSISIKCQKVQTLLHSDSFSPDEYVKEIALLSDQLVQLCDESKKQIMVKFFMASLDNIPFFEEKMVLPPHYEVGAEITIMSKRFKIRELQLYSNDARIAVTRA